MKLLSTSLVLATLLTGCATTPITRVTPSAINYNKVVEDTNNELILMNIVRASKRQPLYFTRLGAISRTDQMMVGLSLSGSLPQRGTSSLTSSETINPTGLTSMIGQTVGRAVDTLTPGASASFRSTPQFNIEILDTQEFYQGILEPLDLTAFYQYVRQGWNPNQLALLTVESIIFKSSNGKNTIKFDNDPDHEGDNMKVFRELMSCTVIDKMEKTYGSTVSFGTPKINTIAEATALSGLLADTAWNFEQAEISYAKNPEIGIRADFSACWKKDKESALLKSVKKQNTDNGFELKNDTEGNPILPKFAEFLQTDDLGGAFSQEGYTVEAVLRSPHGIIYYLGECLRGSKDGATEQPCYIQKEGEAKKYISKIQKGNGDNIVATEMYGQSYFVPKASDTNTDRTSQTIAYVNQLLNLHKRGTNAFGTTPIIAINP